MLPAALLAAWDALLRAGPADEVTLERPAEAFDVISDALSLALVAPEEAALAASVVVEALRTGIRRNTHCCRRSSKREAANDMSRLWKGGLEGIGGLLRCCSELQYSFLRRSQEQKLAFAGTICLVIVLSSLVASSSARKSLHFIRRSSLCQSLLFFKLCLNELYLFLMIENPR